MKKKIMGLCLVFVFMFVAAGWTITLSQQRQSVPIQNLAKQQLIRFHVLANSDSPFDQAVKLKVRDAVIAYLQPLFATASDVNDARRIILENREQIIDIGQTVLAAEGIREDIHMEIGYFDFPIKAYGDVVLPAGNYEAVRILIGQGQGKNWWCVLFPPLCFIDPANATAAVPAISKNENSGALEPTEPNSQVQLKWKLAELWEKCTEKAAVSR